MLTNSNMLRQVLFVEDNVDSIAEEIMAYLRERPMASDSLDGITHWWLVQQAITKNMELVEQALEQLTEEGKILKKTNANITCRDICRVVVTAVRAGDQN